MTNPPNAQLSWKVSFKEWKAAFLETFRGNWDNDNFKEAIKKRVGTHNQAILNKGYSKTACWRILQAFSVIGEGQNQIDKIDAETWKKEDVVTPEKPLLVRKAINELLSCLGASNIEEPWNAHSIPVALQPLPWESKYEELEYFDEKTDYVDSQRFFRSLVKPVRYFCCLHTGEHIRDLIESVVHSGFVKEVVLRPIGTNVIASQGMLPEWFVSVLAANLSIVERKCGFQSDGKSIGGSCKVWVYPFESISPQVGAVTTTEGDNFERVRGVVYNQQWGVRTLRPILNNREQPKFYLSGGTVLPTYRLGFHGSKDADEYGDSDELPTPYGTIKSMRELKQFSREKAREVWLTEEEIANNGISLGDYLRDIMKHETLLSRWLPQSRSRSQ